MAAPLASILALAWTVALFAIVGGVGLIIAAFRWRNRFAQTG
jgi:uncharacterized membrane protein HdeD (DUF308 family)